MNLKYEVLTFTPKVRVLSMHLKEQSYTCSQVGICLIMNYLHCILRQQKKGASRGVQTCSVIRIIFTGKSKNSAFEYNLKYPQ